MMKSLPGLSAKALYYQYCQTRPTKTNEIQSSTEQTSKPS